MAKIPPKRISNSLMNALRGGVVPREGAEYIAVGRKCLTPGVCLISNFLLMVSVGFSVGPSDIIY